MDFSKVYAEVAASVIKLNSYSAKGELLSIGTGVAVGDGSLIITCNHCIVGSYSDIEDSSGAKQIASIVGAAPQFDLALLKISTPLATAARFLWSAPAIGTPVFCVGYPMSVRTPHATFAHVAGFEPITNSNLEGIRLDASINHGNSGGPVFTVDGEIAGIVNAKHGNLSDLLDFVDKAETSVTFNSGGVEVFETLKALVKEMRRNLNLGIGYAIPSLGVRSAFPGHAF